jgi:hypothetical protein
MQGICRKGTQRTGREDFICFIFAILVILPGKFALDAMPVARRKM